jgi:hypothetical protein
VRIGDATKIARELLDLPVGQEPGCPEIGNAVGVDGEERIWGDVDCENEVTIGDATKIARRLLGLTVDQEPGCPEIGAPVDVGDIIPTPVPDWSPELLLTPLTHGDTTRPVVHLTFDDGWGFPHEILDVLIERDARATA